MASILFVDDQPELISSAGAYLRLLGHRVEIAPGYAEGIAAIRREEPQILATDVMMPYGDGFMLLQQLHEIWPGTEAWVILLTTMGADGEPARDWSHTGCHPITIDAYVLKPFKPWQLVLTVEQMLYSRRTGGNPAEWKRACRAPSYDPDSELLARLNQIPAGS